MKLDNRLNMTTKRRIEQRRREFGVMLRGLRIERNLSGAELAAKAGNLSRTTLAMMEGGQRQSGARVSERLADALGLKGETRQNFIVAGLRTTTRDLLPQKSMGLDPEFFRPMWQLLTNYGISSNAGYRVRLDEKLTTESPSVLKLAASRLAEKAENLSTLIRGALDGTGDPYPVDISVETGDGTIMLVQLLPASSKIQDVPGLKQNPASK